MTSVFSALHPSIQQFLITRNMTAPTEPQNQAIPPILSGNHVLLLAPTGLGKTEAALLPLFHRFLEEKNKQDGIALLYITPLRALNRDMLKRTLEWGKHLGISIAVRHGDTSQSERARQSKDPPDILITTPETVQILFTGKRLRKHLQTVRGVIVDEIHELAGDERGAQLAIALERLEEIRTQTQPLQRIGLSATVGSPEEVARYLGGMNNGKNRPVTIVNVDVTKHIDISAELPRVLKSDYAQVRRLSIDPISFASLRRSKELIDFHTSTLLFINTRDGAEILTSRFHLWDEQMKVGVHHGSLSKLARIEAEDDFKAGTLQSLICTSSLELGIDVGDTDFVIQYNSPREVTRLLQRVGRSGHQIGKTSKGVIIATNPEELAESIVIARRSMVGKMEPLVVRHNPLSVLSNQIISIALEYGSISQENMFAIITRAYPFHTLKKELFSQTIQQLKIQRSIWIDEEGKIVKRTNSRHYFLENISMIPDETTYMAVDISSRKKIGKLDESFVLNYGFDGAKIILRGRPWTIVKREDDEILVAPSKDMGEVPSWVGEDIPVPYEVAFEVGALRRLIRSKKKLKQYPTDTYSLSRIVQQVVNQKKQGFVVPDDKTITIEVDEKTMVINACFGTKVNETLGRLISAMLVQSLGESIGISSDAYRIMLELPDRIPPEKIKQIFLTIKPESLEYLLEAILKNSTNIRWQLVHVARKFGAIKKEFDYKNVGVKRLFSLFENSLIFDEVIEKTMWERMDIIHTQEVLQKIHNGDIAIKVQRLSPLALAGFETIRGLMAPQRADRSILMALQKRLQDTDVSLICTNCTHAWNTVVRRVEQKPHCPQCHAIKIAVVRRHYRDVAKLLSKKTRTTEEEKEVKRLHKNASLVLSYGTAALLALVGRGIGPDTAARILRRYNRGDLLQSEELQVKFLRDILKAELNYARTRGFWDNT